MPDRAVGSETCTDCGKPVAVVMPGARVKHNADGTHTVTTVTPPRATDPKTRGRRRG